MGRGCVSWTTKIDLDDDPPKQGIWCGKVLNYEELNNQPFVEDLQLKQTVKNAAGEKLVTTRSPIQLDGEILTSPKAAPKVGEDNLAIHEQFLD